ncbi:MAG: hypothetical protein ACLTER_01810 [Ruminococcus sp.]
MAVVIMFWQKNQSRIFQMNQQHSRQHKRMQIIAADVNHTGSGAASGAKTGDDTPLELYGFIVCWGLITTSIVGLCRKRIM